MVKNLPTKAGDMGSIPGSRRSPGVGNGNPVQCSCQENPKDTGACWAVVHGVAKLLGLLSHCSHVQLWDPIDGSPPGSSVHGILQARALEWGAISFSRGHKESDTTEHART